MTEMSLSLAGIAFNFSGEWWRCRDVHQRQEEPRVSLCASFTDTTFDSNHLSWSPRPTRHSPSPIPGFSRSVWVGKTDQSQAPPPLAPAGTGGRHQHSRSRVCPGWCLHASGGQETEVQDPLFHWISSDINIQNMISSLLRLHFKRCSKNIFLTALFKVVFGGILWCWGFCISKPSYCGIAQRLYC